MFVHLSAQSLTLLSFTAFFAGVSASPGYAPYVPLPYYCHNGGRIGDLVNKLHHDPTGAAFCSYYLNIVTSTSTVMETSTSKIKTTVTDVRRTVTVTDTQTGSTITAPTVTADTSTITKTDDTVTQTICPTDVSTPNGKRGGVYNPPPPPPSCVKPYKPKQISSACSCFPVTTPTTTTTVHTTETVTKIKTTKVLATTTETTTSYPKTTPTFTPVSLPLFDLIMYRSIN
jgi:hypothetical protein